MPISAGFSAAVTAKLDRELLEIFEEAAFPENLTLYCAQNNLTKVMAFADLAESKAEVVKIFARVSELDANDPLKCQPVKSAWRIADARTKAALEAEATGKEPETIRTMGPTERAKVDAAVEAQYAFRWPTSLLPHSSLLTKIEAIYRKQLKETPRIQEARSILDKGAATSQVQFSWKPGTHNLMGTTVEDDGPEVPTLWAFKTKRQILMIAYVHADAPEFAKADLTTLLDYHEWLMNKLHSDPRPKLGARIDADFRMRTEWTLSLCNREFETITAAAKHHRSESIHLFSKPAQRPPGGERPGAASQDKPAAAAADPPEPNPTTQTGHQPEQEQGRW